MKVLKCIELNETSRKRKGIKIIGTEGQHFKQEAKTEDAQSLAESQTYLQTGLKLEGKTD